MENFFKRVKEFQFTLEAMLSKLDTWQKKEIALTRYLTVFHPHFIVWVSAMQNASITPAALYAAQDNILLELSENHQGMLLDFMSQMDIQPSFKEYLLLKPTIDVINDMNSKAVRQKCGLNPALVVYLLEELSKVFIPWIEKVAIQKNVDDLTYTKKHGEADAKHSDLAYNAVVAEFNLGSSDEKRLRLATDAVIDLLRLIFVS